VPFRFLGLLQFGSIRAEHFNRTLDTLLKVCQGPCKPANVQQTVANSDVDCCQQSNEFIDRVQGEWSATRPFACDETSDWGRLPQNLDEYIVRVLAEYESLP
jgi:hypothetical protein